jgi:hypothetical protein
VALEAERQTVFTNQYLAAIKAEPLPQASQDELAKITAGAQWSLSRGQRVHSTTSFCRISNGDRKLHFILPKQRTTFVGKIRTTRYRRGTMEKNYLTHLTGGVENHNVRLLRLDFWFIALALIPPGFNRSVSVCL